MSSQKGAIWGSWDVGISMYFSHFFMQDQSIRKRSIVQAPEEGGADCKGALEETKPCGGPADTDCHVGDWHEWTSCSAVCGKGRHTRMRRLALSFRGVSTLRTDSSRKQLLIQVGQFSTAQEIDKSPNKVLHCFTYLNITLLQEAQMLHVFPQDMSMQKPTMVAKRATSIS